MHFNYPHEPNSNLLCCICRVPFIEPVTTRTCSHTFCRTCISEALEHARQCPVCRSPLFSVDDLSPANPIIRSLVDELVVKCIHSECPHTCQRQLLTAHLLDSCPFSLVACPNAKCDQTLARRDAPSHDCTQNLAVCDLCESKVPIDDLEDHVSKCQDGTTTCASCSANLSRSAAASHTATCPAAIIECPQVANGCSWIGPRSAFDSTHEQACPYIAIGSFLALNTAKFAQTAQDNFILRQKIDTLEDTIASMRRELQSVKAGLGPWYRPDEYSIQSYSVPASELPIDLQPSSASGSSGFPIPDTPFGPTVDHAPQQDVLAAYFPSEAPRTAQPQPTRRRTLPGSPSGWDGPASTPTNSRHVHTHSVGSAISGPGPASTTIAPLNLSGSLYGALTGIRESLVSLGTSLDSLGRRTDIALTNESMRVNEDTMALRASIHGLRMQVHTIMMDRNAAAVTGRNLENPSLSLGADGTWPSPSPTPFLSGPGRFYYPPPPGTTKL
ncbi:TRAF-type zinc finger protein [Mycena kentingensis (nom. inval.)]|nr:TRAF-type zinc finger protein [Mycena kentingensis (nom. inval.)]